MSILSKYRPPTTNPCPPVRRDQPLTTTPADIPRFLRAWLSNPRLVGAIWPSSAGLAGAITAEITPASAPVLELGPGTGVFTRALLGRGVPENKLALLEYEPRFARLLQHRFPAARVLCLDAARLSRANLFNHELAGAVVSGLPLLSMSPKRIIGILEGAFAHLRPGAAFHQFTYGLVCPVPRPILDRLGLKAVRTGRVFANLPPAFVYRITRRRPVIGGRRAETRAAPAKPHQRAAIPVLHP